MNKKPSPPKLPLRFFRWYCHQEYQEDIEGDLLERFETKVEDKGIKEAKWGFFMDVIRLFRPGIIRSLEGSYQLNHYGMFKNYFKIGWRNLSRNKGYSSLNIIGLSVGLACFTICGLWVKDELNYDRFHEHANQIYRVSEVITDDSGKIGQAVTPAQLAPTLIRTFPEILDAVRIDKRDETVQFGDKQFIEDDILLTDPSFFNIFTFNLISGNSQSALKDPYSIVLSERLATKYFGDEDPVGQSLRMFMLDPDGLGREYKVTGVIENCPPSSHFNYNMLVSFKTLEVNDSDVMQTSGWDISNFYTYVLLQKGSNPKQLESKLAMVSGLYLNKNRQANFDYFLQPLTSIRLHSNLRYEIDETSSISYLFIFATIGTIVLLLACINYISLSTALASNRFKEVGLRKVMGALRKQLVGQYLIESCLIALSSLLLAFAWIELFSFLFESQTSKPITGLYAPRTLITIVIVTTLVGLGSGLYPSLILSSFRPANILKGLHKTGTNSLWMRKALVIVQYGITTVLLIGILVVQLQLRFIQHKDLGFDRSQLLILGVNGSEEVKKGYDVFANELLANSSVINMARSNSMIADGLESSLAELEDTKGKKARITVHSLRVDHEYFNTFKMNLVAGRFFSKNVVSDSSNGFIINESATRAFGYPAPMQALGKPLNFEGRRGEIIGVVRDFHYSPLQNKIEPVCMYLLAGHFSRIAVRSIESPKEFIMQITEMWEKHFPNSVVDFRFAEESINSTYKSEQRFSNIFFFIAAISLLIACLGLFALVSFSAKRRMKEVGVRKVLGASFNSILGLFSIEFLKLIVIATLIAIPIGYYAAQEWLSGFVYRIELHPFIFVLAVVFVVIIAWITISYQSIKAALTNPVDSLRDE